MKFATQVIELMSAYPGRDFKMAELVRYARPRATPREKLAVRRAIARVLDSLEAAGSISKNRSRIRGSFAKYRWKR